jgi:predicted ferric reductase
MLPKNLWGWVAIIVLAVSPLPLWFFALPFAYRFNSTQAALTSLGQLSSLVGLVLFACTLILSSRLKLFESYFGGLNRAYIAHHYFGIIAFILFLLHPVFLASAYLPAAINLAANIFFPSTTDWAKNLGQAGLYLMISLMLVTLFVKLPYHFWKLTHKFMGLAFLLGAAHSLFISSDISRFLPLKIYFGIIILVAIISYMYRTVLGKFLVPKTPAVVVSIKNLSRDTVEIELEPLNKKLKFVAGQFLFVSFPQSPAGAEWHPFSIVSSPSQDHICIAIKALGDYTNLVSSLHPESQALIEGPFGQFFYQTGKKSQIWVAGGIGVTPFVSMARSLESDYDVHLFYSVKDRSEAVYYDDLKKIGSENVHFDVFLHESKSLGRLTADVIKEKSGEILGKEFFICGPPMMMKSLRTQLNKMGIRNGRIHTEEFSLE